LYHMVRGRQRDAWHHTAQILAMLYNANRHPRARPMRPVEFHPFYSVTETTGRLSDLRHLFTSESRSCRAAES
jgi:hypothetical protein